MDGPAFPVKTTLLATAGVLLLSAVLFWAVTGAHRGWTKTSVPVKVLDEVTGLEGVDYQKRFVPGVDFLAGSALLAGLLAGGSLFFRKKTKES